MSYDLCGVANHYGTVSGGHYTAFGRSYRQGAWYKFDDKKVSKLKEIDVPTEAAYILFYAQSKM